MDKRTVKALWWWRGSTWRRTFLGCTASIFTARRSFGGGFGAIRRAAVVLRQRGDRVHVGLACALGHATDRQIVFELLAQRAHRVSPHVIAGTSPPDHADTRAQRMLTPETLSTSRNFSER